MILKLKRKLNLKLIMIKYFPWKIEIHIKIIIISVVTTITNNLILGLKSIIMDQQNNISPHQNTQSHKNMK